MGHYIGYMVVKENVSRRSVMEDIQEIALREGDNPFGYKGSIKWHEKLPPFKTEEEAEEFIKKADNGWYDDHAVRFYDYSKVKPTAKVITYENKIKELREEWNEYVKKHSIKTFQAKYIGCLKCGSKLNKEYIKHESCSLCGNDLRSKTTLDKIKWYKDKISEYYKRIESEKMKDTSKATIKWLVKYEFHC